jgi:hypothetical protein
VPFGRAIRLTTLAVGRLARVPLGPLAPDGRVLLGTPRRQLGVAPLLAPLLLWTS